MPGGTRVANRTKCEIENFVERKICLREGLTFAVGKVRATMKSVTLRQMGVGAIRVAGFLWAVVSAWSSVFALPLVTSLTETGTGLNATGAIVTSATSRLPQPEGDYSSGALVDEAFSFVTRTAEWTAVRTNDAGMLNTTGTTLHPFPSYLSGLEYIQIANENRAVANYAINVTLSAPAKAYLFLDNRIDGLGGNTKANNTDPVVVTGPLSWVVTDGWTRVNTGFMPNGQADYIGIDEGATVALTARSHAETAALIPGSGNGLNNFMAIFTKDFPTSGAIVGLTKMQASGTPNMYGVAFASLGPPPILGDVNGNGTGGEYPADFLPIQMNFRKAGNRSMGDLSGNGTIDFPDFREWKSVHLGMGGSLAGLDLGFLGANVPEPNTIVVLLMALAGLAPCRMKRN